MMLSTIYLRVHIVLTDSGNIESFLIYYHVADYQYKTFDNLFTLHDCVFIKFIFRFN